MDDSIGREIRECAGQSGKGFAPLADSYDLWLDPGTQGARGVIFLTVSATGISVPDAQTRRLSQEDQPGGLGVCPSIQP
jgi:hypothetical protein